MKTETEIIDFITDVQNYFEAAAIGSYVLYLNRLLDFRDLNDIDVLVDDSRSKNLFKFMESKGYKQTIRKAKQIGYDNVTRAVQYELINEGDFTKKGSLNIDVLVSDKVEIYSVEKIISEKFKRGSNNDFETLLKVVALKSGVDIKKLKHEYDSTRGLFCIDKNPKKVSKKWIEDNAFQLN